MSGPNSFLNPWDVLNYKLPLYGDQYHKNKPRGALSVTIGFFFIPLSYDVSCVYIS